MMTDFDRDFSRVWIHPTHHAQYFQDGLRVIAFEEGDIEVEAVLDRDEATGHWYATPDWSTQVDPDEA